MRNTVRFAIGLVTIGLLLTAAAPALAFGSFGTYVDTTCTARGWVPAKPFNPNNQNQDDPAKTNCGLCHLNAANPGGRLVAAGVAFERSRFVDVSPFCSAPAPMNHAPVFAAISAKMATAGQQLQFGVSATDQDGDAIALSVSNSPNGATFTDAGNGTGTFRWTPTAAQNGNRTVTFHANDAGSPMASATLDVLITVGAMTNRPPVLAPVGDKQVNTGTQLAINLSASDPDGNSLTFSVMPLPAGATLNGAAFRWTPSAGQVGSYPVTVRVTDSGTPAANDSEAIVITVGRVNRPPSLAPIGDRSVNVGQTARIALVASDADGDPLTLACSGLPGSAAFTDVGNGTGEIVWSPSAPGSSSVTCSATDNAMPVGRAQETFMLSALATNPPAGAPVISEASWDPDRAHGSLHVAGDGAADGLEIFAILDDGSALKLGQRGAEGDFDLNVRPFIPPCQVAVASGGLMGATLGVAGAPASCDLEPLMTLRAKSSCDGFKLKVRGKRAPADAVITGIDPATGDLVFQLTTTRGGSFHTKLATSAFAAQLEVRVEAAGQTWMLPELVDVRNKCD